MTIYEDTINAAPPSATVWEVGIRLNGIGEGGPYPVVNGVCVLPQSVAENLVASAVGQQVKRELLAQWASYKQPASPSGEVVAYRWRDRGTMQMVYSDTNPGYCNVEPLYTAAQQPAGVDGGLTPTGTFCSVCRGPQHNTPSGVSCPMGHGGAAPLSTANSAVAAIRFALSDPEGMAFLRLWNEGEFDTLRREWPDAPSSIYIGADSLAQQATGVDEKTTWSRQQPTVPGIYGIRGFNLCRPASEQFEAVVVVREHGGELVCNLHESTSEDDLESWVPICDLNPDFEWRVFVSGWEQQEPKS